MIPSSIGRRASSLQQKNHIQNLRAYIETCRVRMPEATREKTVASSSHHSTKAVHYGGWERLRERENKTYNAVQQQVCVLYCISSLDGAFRYAYSVCLLSYKQSSHILVLLSSYSTRAKVTWETWNDTLRSSWVDLTANELPSQRCWVSHWWFFFFQTLHLNSRTAFGCFPTLFDSPLLFVSTNLFLSLYKQPALFFKPGEVPPSSPIPTPTDMAGGGSPFL